MGVRRPGFMRLPVFGTGLLAFTASRAMAVSPAVSVRQYLLSSWTAVDGKPFPAIYQLAQTADGYLWMGSDTGLLRFDGMRFRAGLPRGEPTPTDPVRAIAPSSQGGL